MKNIVIAMTLVLFASTANARCNSEDTKVGLVTAATAGVVMTVATVASLPLTGPGIAAGTTVGVARAVTGRILMKTTLPTAIFTMPSWGTLGFFLGRGVSCAHAGRGGM